MSAMLATMNLSNLSRISAHRLKVSGVVLFYIVTSLSMVFVNKSVLSSAPDLPFTLLFIQMLVAVALLHCLALVVPNSSPIKEDVTAPKINSITAYRLSPPLGLGFLVLVSNTLCLRSVDVSFFQIARGMLLPFTVGITALQAGSIPNRNVLQAAALVTAGFLFGISPSAFFSSGSFPLRSGTDGAWDTDKILALVYGTSSALVTAVHAVMVKNAVKEMNGSVLRLAYCSNLTGCVLLFPCIFLNGESTFLVNALGFSGSPVTDVFAFDGGKFLAGATVAGFCGFMLGLAGLLSIKVTSPVTHMATSATRSALQTILGVALLGEVVTRQRAMSIGIITIGALYYTYIQSSSSFPHFPPSPTIEATDEKLGSAPSLRRVRNHGTTLSLDTILPLHHRPRSLTRLRSISEMEEEYMYTVPFLDEEKEGLLMAIDHDALTG